MKKQQWQYIDMWAKKIRAINYLGSKCKHCSDNNIFHLIFHHKNDDKEFSVSEIKGHRWSKIKNEIQKCDLLCENCHQELHYMKNDINENERFRKNKSIYLEYKGSKCDRCNYNNSKASLIFHHKIPEYKSFGISRIKKTLKNVHELDEYIIEELDKCEVICRNCHLEEHVDKELFEKYKKEIYFKVYNFKEISPKIPREKIYEMYNDGIKQKDIATHFNVSRGTISSIIKKMHQ